jgi:hypothetical protein
MSKEQMEQFNSEAQLIFSLGIVGFRLGQKQVAQEMA